MQQTHLEQQATENGLPSKLGPIAAGTGANHKEVKEQGNTSAPTAVFENEIQEGNEGAGIINEGMMKILIALQSRAKKTLEHEENIFQGVMVLSSLIIAFVGLENGLRHSHSLEEAAKFLQSSPGPEDGIKVLSCMGLIFIAWGLMDISKNKMKSLIFNSNADARQALESLEKAVIDREIIISSAGKETYNILDGGQTTQATEIELGGKENALRLVSLSAVDLPPSKTLLRPASYGAPSDPDLLLRASDGNEPTIPIRRQSGLGRLAGSLYNAQRKIKKVIHTIRDGLRP